MRMFKRLGRILGLAVVIAGLTSLAAYDLAASSVEGKVIEIDSAANRVVVETTTGSRVTVMADPQTMILAGNESKRLADIHVSDSVKVSYTTAGSTNTATDIEVTMAASGSAPAATDTYAQNDMGRSGSDTYPSSPSNTPSANSNPSGSTHQESDHLPQTGSSLPLVGLTGLLLLGIGIAVRVVRMSVS